MKPKTITNILLQRTEKNIATTEERKKEYILRVGFVRELTIQKRIVDGKIKLNAIIATHLGTLRKIVERSPNKHKHSKMMYGWSIVVAVTI